MDQQQQAMQQPGVPQGYAQPQQPMQQPMHQQQFDPMGAVNQLWDDAKKIGEIPAGKYTTKLISVEVQGGGVDTTTGVVKDQYFKVTFKIREGDMAGRQITKNCGFWKGRTAKGGTYDLGAQMVKELLMPSGFTPAMIQPVQNVMGGMDLIATYTPIFKILEDYGGEYEIEVYEKKNGDMENKIRKAPLIFDEKGNFLAPQMPVPAGAASAQQQQPVAQQPVVPQQQAPAMAPPVPQQQAPAQPPVQQQAPVQQQQAPVQQQQPAAQQPPVPQMAPPGGAAPVASGGGFVPPMGPPQ